MAGSYHHVTDQAGRLLSPHEVGQMLENGGDVYEAVEEMYAMIWHLANRIARTGIPIPAMVHVENARQAYIEDGLRGSPGYAVDHEAPSEEPSEQ